ncbi:MAG: hypothetical protein CUN55_13235 [Phototrophicales bacterium]|nr:MAG: hypothetical protein CUN55_13235 [Phototrophicales bacterium]
MDDLYEKIVSQRRGFAWLAGKMPGFSGYMEHTSRRTADRMMREHVARELRSQLDQFNAAEKALVQNGGLHFMNQAKSIRTKFQTLIDRIATDAPGYSGFFAANRITPDDLEAIYAFDEAMLRYVEDFSEKIEQLRQAITNRDGVEEALAQLDALTIEANRAYDLRDDVLKGIV